MTVLAGRRAVIYEPRSEGHWLHYVDYLLRTAAVEDVEAVLLTNRQAAESATFRSLIAGRCRLEIFDGSGLSWRQIGEAAEEFGAQTLILPSGDEHLVSAARNGWNGPGDVRILIMRTDAQPSLSPLRRLLFHAVKRSAMAIAERRRNVSVYRLVSATSSSWTSREVPDPVLLTPMKDAASRVPVLPPEVRWVTVIGALSSRKNITLVAQGVSIAQREVAQLGLCLAGFREEGIEAEVEVARLASRKEGWPIRVIDGPIGDEDFDAIVRESAVVVTAHSNEGPSGVLVRAVALGTPVVAAGARALRVDAERRRDAVRWVQLSAEDLAIGFREAATAPRPRVQKFPGPEVFARKLLLGA